MTETYGEVLIPVLDNLSIEASFRNSDYSNLDEATSNSKFALRYDPSEWLGLMFVAAEGFRAPSIDELFGPQQLTAATYSDPCRNWGALPSTGTQVQRNIRANCAADGLPENFALTSDQATGLLGGNPNLEPEVSDSTVFGVVLRPSPDLSIAIDSYSVEIENAIGSLGTDDIIVGCYQSANFSSPLCDLITGPATVGAGSHHTSPRRDALNTIAGQILTNENLATFTAEGVDITLDYGMDLANGRLNINWAATLLSNYEYVAFAGAEATKLSGKFGTDPIQGDNSAAFPDLKFTLGLTYTGGNWSGNWRLKYLGPVDDVAGSAANLENEIDAYMYHDVQATWNAGEGFDLTFGVRNLLDEDPPYVSNYDDMNTIHYSYDTAGQYFYSGLKATF